MSKLDLGNSLILNSDFKAGQEIKTGATFKGKPIYCSLVSTTMPSARNTFTQRAHGIADISNILNFFGDVNDMHPYWYGLNYYRTDSNFCFCSVDRTYINFAFGNDCPIPLNRGVNVFLFYTKSTDA